MRLCPRPPRHRPVGREGRAITLLEQAIIPRLDSRADLRYCQHALARGSRSFATAARLLPRRVREPATVVYAYCRHADDVIDLGRDAKVGLRQLRHELDRVFSGRPFDDPVERALTRVVEAHALPRAPFEALIEGFSWDARGLHVRDESGLIAYGVRVASTVGVITSALMGVRDRDALARACDLGVAMQLTNIARDVGEDARGGRVYLPDAWLHEENLTRETVLGARVFAPAIGRVVARVLGRAAELYECGEAGIATLPKDCQPAIRAAAWIYADIGDVIARRAWDSVTARAHTSTWRKLWLAWCARWAAPVTNGRALRREPLPEAAELVAACERA